MKVVWSPLAINRVLEAAHYIGQDNLAVAEKWAEGIFDAVAKLGKFPECGRVVPEVGRSDIRELLVGNYRVIYRFSESEVSVLTVRHGRRLFGPTELDE